MTDAPEYEHRSEHRHDHAWGHPAPIDGCAACQRGIERNGVDHLAELHHPDRPCEPLTPRGWCLLCDAWLAAYPPMPLPRALGLQPVADYLAERRP